MRTLHVAHSGRQGLEIPHLRERKSMREPFITSDTAARAKAWPLEGYGSMSPDCRRAVESAAVEPCELCSTARNRPRTLGGPSRQRASVRFPCHGETWIGVEAKWCYTPAVWTQRERQFDFLGSHAAGKKQKVSKRVWFTGPNKR